MKITLLISFVLFTFIAVSCSKNDSNNTDNPHNYINNNKPIKAQLQYNLDINNYYEPADFYWAAFYDGSGIEPKYGEPNIDDFNDECLRLHGSLDIVTDNNTTQLFKDGKMHICHVPVRFEISDVIKSTHISYNYLLQGYLTIPDKLENLNKVYMKPDIFEHPQGGNANLVASHTKIELKIGTQSVNDLEHDKLNIIE